MYNLIARKIEEIFPLLDEYNIDFWAYNPLAGGLLTGKYNNLELNYNCRFKNNEIYQNIFWKKEILENLT
jgi:aflatoxin B1 aldehyde reductase